MAKKHNFRKPKNGNPMPGAGGAKGRARKGGGNRPMERKLSPVEKKLIATENAIRKKLQAKYGNLLKQFSMAKLAEIIRSEFGDDPIGAVLEKSDPIRDALRQMYGKPN